MNVTIRQPVWNPDRQEGCPDSGLLEDLQKLKESDKPEIHEAAENAYRKYKFKLEMLELLPK